MIRNSQTHPLRIDSVIVPGTGGLIGMTFCPGKKQADAFSGSWDRDLKTDLAVINAWNAEILISLLEPHEYSKVGVDHLPTLVPENMLHHQLPIKDVSVPDATWEEEWKLKGPLVRSVLRRGGRICLHCMGGLGRTGTIAALLLVELGMDPDAAINSVRSARQDTIETPEQEKYIRSHGGLSWRIDKYRGCLLGGAVGDALGAPVEFMAKENIFERFGPAGVRNFEANDYGLLGAITDDTQMTLFTAEGLLRTYVRGKLGGMASYSGCVHHAYLRWLKTQGSSSKVDKLGMDGWLVTNTGLFSRRAPGVTCISALEAASGFGIPKTACNDSKGCGGVMRAAPVGLYAASMPFPETDRKLWAFKTGCEVAALTHGHPSGYLPAGMLAVIILELLVDSSFSTALQAAKEILLDHPGHEETMQAIEKAEALAKSDTPSSAAIEELGRGWVAEEALSISVFCSLRATSFEEGIINAVNITGDSDSTGAITGNILGTRFGAKSIHPQWSGAVELRDVILALADDLASFGDWFLDTTFSLDSTGLEGRLKNKDLKWWCKRYPGW